LQTIAGKKKLLSLRKLNQIPARIVKRRQHHGSHLLWFRLKPHALFFQPILFFLNIVDGKRGPRNTGVM
jgi:hypothetical protein